MKGIIVAAGIGSRLGELTKNTPKSLIEINGKSILERQIFTFKKLGITDITVIIGPHAEKYSFEGISFIHDDSYLEHDILSSFMLARKIINDETIVSYGDVMFDENILQSLINFELKSKDSLFSKLLDSENGKLGEFVGLMKLSKQGGKIFTEKYEKLIKTHTGPFHEADSLSDAYFTDMLQELIESNVDISPISVKGKWCEIDTMQDLKRAEEMF